MKAGERVRMKEHVKDRLGEALVRSNQRVHALGVRLPSPSLAGATILPSRASVAGGVLGDVLGCDASLPHRIKILGVHHLQPRRPDVFSNCTSSIACVRGSAQLPAYPLPPPHRPLTSFLPPTALLPRSHLPLSLAAFLIHPGVPPPPLPISLPSSFPAVREHPDFPHHLLPISLPSSFSVV